MLILHKEVQIYLEGKNKDLAIARAIARNPEIYIFDDSFSALDYKTDSILRKELKNYTKDATSLIVAQRIGTNYECRQNYSIR